MKNKLFDFVIGNPPYQEDVENKGDRPNPIYNRFMDEAYMVGNVVELIHPARFLFNAGQTPKDWNEKMLNDEHFKVLHYEADAEKIFPDAEIKGGVAVTIRDVSKRFGAIRTFTPYEELNHIIQKIANSKGFIGLDSIVAPRGNYRTTGKFFSEHPYAMERLGKGSGNMLVSNFFEKIPEAISKVGDDCLSILGRKNNTRTIFNVKREYIQHNDFLTTYNIASPEANGSGKFGEKLTTGEILLPGQGATDTFVSIGKFSTQEEARNLQTYMKTKFFRAMLGVKKVTQHCPPSVWAMIPIQDFTSNSDIDWSQSIYDIDQQLYRKYRLSDDEIEFIETHVKEMN